MGKHMRSGGKIKILCAACAAAVLLCGGALGAYYAAVGSQADAGAAAEGVFDSRRYLALRAEAPFGDESGISPMKINCAVDVDAMRADGFSGTVSVEFCVSFARGVNFEGFESAAQNTFALAEVSASVACGENILQSSISCNVRQGETGCLNAAVEFDLPSDGDCAITLRVAFDNSQLGLFKANGDSLFNVTAAVQKIA